MKRTLARTTATAALTVVLAAGVGAGTAYAEPAVASAAAATPSYCKALTKVEKRHPALYAKLPPALRNAIDKRCTKVQVPVQDTDPGTPQVPVQDTGSGTPQAPVHDPVS